MATQKVYTYYKELPDWAKGVVVVGGIAIIYFTAKSIIKRIRQSSLIREAKQTVDAVTRESRNLQNTGMRASYPSSQFQAWADGLQKQLDGCDGGGGMRIDGVTYSPTGRYLLMILNNLKNDVDYLELIKAYGVRTHDQCGYWTGDFTGNLPQAITDELTSTERQGLNTVLGKKGITYKI